MELTLLCDCGKEFVEPYMRVYRGSVYSCGCAKRARSNAADYTGTIARNGNGNCGTGRTLYILYQDPVTLAWHYTCDCCAGDYVVPGGAERGIQATLQKIAGEECPGYRVFFYIRKRLYYHYARAAGCPSIDKMVRWERLLGELESCYDEGYIVRSKDGKVIGFRGGPQRKYGSQEQVQVVDVGAEAREVQADQESFNRPVEVDPDGFADVAVFD